MRLTIKELWTRSNVLGEDTNGHVTRNMRGSMQQDEQGNLIEFDGCEFQMNREEYEQALAPH